MICCFHMIYIWYYKDAREKASFRSIIFQDCLTFYQIMIKQGEI